MTSFINYSIRLYPLETPVPHAIVRLRCCCNVKLNNSRNISGTKTTPQCIINAVSSQVSTAAHTNTRKVHFLIWVKYKAVAMLPLHWAKTVLVIALLIYFYCNVCVALDNTVLLEMFLISLH